MDEPLRSNDSSHHLAPAPPRERHAARVAVTLVAIAAFVGVAWSVYARHRTMGQLSRATEAQAVVTVATTQPRPLEGNTELVLPGNLQADYEASIYARTSGYLSRWLVDIGARVKAGELLAQIDAPEIDQQLRQAEADLAMAEANERIAQVTAARWLHLRASDSVSKQEADEKVSAAQASAAQVEAARANVLRLRDLKGFERIVAPFNGVITARDTDVGQLIDAGSGSGPELFRIADVRRLRVYVRVPQTYAAVMRPGLTAQLRFPGRPHESYLARLDTTSSAIDPATRTLMVELIVDNEKGELLPGAYTEVHFDLPASAGGPSFELPANVLLFRGDGLHVATVGADDRVVMKPVSIGRDFGSSIEIIAGLKASDRVILNPPDSLTDGVMVRVVKQAAPGRITKS
jgi:RND family efflux transporter MFP subunit